MNPSHFAAKHRAAPRLFTLALLLALASGCHKKTAAPPPGSFGPTLGADSGTAPTATLTADPLAIELGQTVSLNWRTTNATTVTIDGLGPVASSGTQMVAPSTSTNFHLIAKNTAGLTAESNVRVTVRVATAPNAMGDSADNQGNMGPDAAFHRAVPDAFFDYDSYELRPDAAAASTQAAAYLAANPNIRVLVAGYSDERGSAEYNLALGENRANSAKTALVAAGISADRLRTVSYGKEKQFCSESNETCWQQNRRAQFTVDR